MTTELEFRMSETVAALTEVYQQYTPPAGSTVHVNQITAEGPYKIATEVRVVWDHGGSEEFLWTIKGSGNFGNRIVIPSSKTDGVKKLALVLDNGELASVNLSGYMIIVVEE